ncbi:MAG: hypothetical protein JO316_24960 [Abitibacteriaceae bacterium]|nr:hypothetical protein [Abditibacteriaceae bacterium]MBV9868619.1 hypothetical protein [Abditibacteriaceae bacterium]
MAKPDQRAKTGRRKSDWLIPLLGLVLISLAACWAIYNYVQMQEAEKLNKTLQTVVVEHARLKKIYERQTPKTAIP